MVPITEPAVGYGAAGGLVFFHTRPRSLETPEGPRVIPPNATATFGMLTENGSWAGGAGHMHTWDQGRLRYSVGGAHADLNLDWFGQSDAFEGQAFSYNMEVTGLMQKASFRLGDSDFYLGATQRLAGIDTGFDQDPDLPPPGSGLGILADELDMTISGLGLTLAYDTRNSLFSPTAGTKASLTGIVYDDAIGSDRDYVTVDAEVCHYVPLGGPFTLGLRGQSSYASEEAPFFDLAMVRLRGIQVGRYVDNTAFTLESELRWDLTKRWTAVGFGGVGWVADEFDELDDAEDNWAGGGGVRYLIARKYDLRLGLDVARGPEDWALYVMVGTGWLRD